MVDWDEGYESDYLCDLRGAECKVLSCAAFLIATIMGTVGTILQLIIPLGIFNVWLLRAGRSTAYRGGAAASLKAEFAAYGLPDWSYYVIGVLKLSAAALLLLGFLLPVLVLPGAALMAALMLGAVLMHAKVNDPAIRYLPAFTMLVMSLIVLF